MIRILLFLMLATPSFQFLMAQTANFRPVPPPKLVIGIVVENMRPDYIERYWEQFGNNGFKKLYSRGTVVANMKMAQHMQNYASGTATLFTGVYPGFHGIVDAVWYDRLRSREVQAVTDDYYFTVGADSKSGNASPRKLLTTTIGDNLKLATLNRAKVFTVAMNAESAILAAGHAADGAWWFDPVSGRMISSSFYVSNFPEWARDFNMVSQGEKYSGRNWVTLHHESVYSASLADNHPLEAGYNGRDNTFPHALGRLVRRAESFAPIKTTPYANTIVREFAAALMMNEGVGNDAIPDLITLFFSSMDYENNSFGPASREMQDLYLRLDEEIAQLITFAEEKFGRDDVVFFLTANTSASYPVNFLKETFRMPVGDFNLESTFALLNSFLNITFGEERWIEHLSGNQVYLDRRLIERMGIDLKAMQLSIAEFITQFEGVKAALPSYNLEQYPVYNGPLAALYRTYMMSRSGDVLYMLNEGWQPTHRFRRLNYTDQIHIPLVFYGARINSGIITEPFEAIDLAPTLSEIMQIPMPDKSIGRAIPGL